MITNNLSRLLRFPLALVAFTSTVRCASPSFQAKAPRVESAIARSIEISTQGNAHDNITVFLRSADPNYIQIGLGRVSYMVFKKEDISLFLPPLFDLLNHPSSTISDKAKEIILSAAKGTTNFDSIHFLGIYMLGTLLRIPDLPICEFATACIVELAKRKVDISTVSTFIQDNLDTTDVERGTLRFLSARALTFYYHQNNDTKSIKKLLGSNDIKKVGIRLGAAYTALELSISDPETTARSLRIIAKNEIFVAGDEYFSASDFLNNASTELLKRLAKAAKDARNKEFEAEINKVLSYRSN